MAATLLGSLLVSLGLDSGQFRSGLSDAEKQMKATSKRFQTIGANIAKVGVGLTAGITAPFAALIAKSIPAAEESAQATAQVTAALKSMGDASGRTLPQLAALAGHLQDISVFDDDDIMKSVTANLLTFGNVSGKVFDQAQEAIVNISARMGTDLQSATVMVGKALNDPIKGLAALQRVGIQFTEQQKDQIKAMVAGGNAAGAQAIMLGELQRQFGGAALAQRNATPNAAMQQQWRTLQENIGAVALKVLPPLLDGLERVLAAFNQLSPQMQTFAVGAAAVGAAFGPLLIGVGGVVAGFGKLLPVLTQMGAASGVAAEGASGAAVAATGLGEAIGIALPWVAAIAGAAALVYAAFEHWDDIKVYLDGLSQRTQAASDQINGFFKSINDWADKTDQRLGTPTRDELFTGWSKAAGDAWAKINSYDLAAWAAGVDAKFAMLAANAPIQMQRLYEGVKIWISDRLNAVWDGVKAKVSEVGDYFHELWDRVVGHSYIPDMVDAIGEHMARLDALMVNPAKTATDATGRAFQALQQRVSSILDNLFPEQAAFNKLKADIDDLTAYAKKAGWSPDQLSTAVDKARSDYFGSLDTPTPGPLEVAPDIGASTTSIAKSIGDVASAANDKYLKIAAANDNLGDSFATMSRNVTSSLQGLANSIKSGDWLSSLTGLLDVITQLAGSGIFGKGAQAFASSFRSFGGGRALGGPVLPNTDYLVGEKGPEILRLGGRGGSIVPNNKIGDGGSGGVLEIRLKDQMLDARIVSGAARVTQAGIADNNVQQSKYASRRLGTR